MTKKQKIKAGDWVRVYDDKTTTSGGGQHVLKEYDYSEEEISRFERDIISALLDGDIQGGFGDLER